MELFSDEIFMEKKKNNEFNGNLAQKIMAHFLTRYPLHNEILRIFKQIVLRTCIFIDIQQICLILLNLIIIYLK